MLLNMIRKPRIKSTTLNPTPLLISEFTLRFDGCSKGNPGIGGAGAVLYKNDVEIWNSCKFIGMYITNNQAEYEGLLLGLTRANEMKIQKLLVEGDSNLVIKQMKGEYKVKSLSILELYNKCVDLSRNIPIINYQHIYRERNKRADELSNKSLETFFSNDNNRIVSSSSFLKPI